MASCVCVESNVRPNVTSLQVTDGWKMEEVKEIARMTQACKAFQAASEAADRLQHESDTRGGDIVINAFCSAATVGFGYVTDPWLVGAQLLLSHEFPMPPGSATTVSVQDDDGTITVGWYPKGMFKRGDVYLVVVWDAPEHCTRYGNIPLAQFVELNPGFAQWAFAFMQPMRASKRCRKSEADAPVSKRKYNY